MSSVFDEAARRADEAAARADEIERATQAASDEILALARNKISALNRQIPELFDHLRRQSLPFNVFVVEFRHNGGKFKRAETRQVPVGQGWRLTDHAFEDINMTRDFLSAAIRYFSIGLVLLDSGEVYEYTTKGTHKLDPGYTSALLIRRYDVNQDLPPAYLASVSDDDLLKEHSFQITEIPGPNNNYNPAPKRRAISSYSLKFAEIISKHYGALAGPQQPLPYEALMAHAWVDKYEERLIGLAGYHT